MELGKKLDNTGKLEKMNLDNCDKISMTLKLFRRKALGLI